MHIKGELTLKQRMFCNEYQIDYNGTQAAIRAGYSKKTANEQAAQLLAKLSIKNEINRLQNERIRSTGITAEYVMKSLHEVAEYTKTPRPRLNKDGEIIGESIDSAGANRSLELIGKLLGAFDTSDGPQKIVIDLRLPEYAGWTRPYHEVDDET
jgi:phage terminase small subunit